MGTHPINLALRFLLELAALFSMGLWGWRTGEGWLRFALASLLPIAAAAVWGTFAVPDDPSRSGAAPIAVPGLLRLAIEAAVFGFGAWALHHAGHPRLGWALGIIVVLHYAISYDRILWLIER